MLRLVVVDHGCGSNVAYVPGLVTPRHCMSSAVISNAVAKNLPFVSFKVKKQTRPGLSGSH